jgi:hypothetical protein
LFSFHPNLVSTRLLIPFAQEQSVVEWLDDLEDKSKEDKKPAANFLNLIAKACHNFLHTALL